MQQQLFPTSIVGSLPRPKFIQDAIAGNEDPFSLLLDRGVQFAVALQEQAGLDVVSDGEWRRKSYIGPISTVTGSFTDYEPKGEPWRYIVTQKIVHRFPGFFAREAAFLKKQTNRKIKVAIPSPYLIGQRCWDAQLSAGAYPHRRDFVEAIIPILKKEIELLRDAGTDIVQLDDPHFCLLADDATRRQFADPDAELRYAHDTINEVVRDVRDVYIALHLCRRNKGRKGWLGEGGYDRIMTAMSSLNVQQFVLEYTIPAAGDTAILRDLPKHSTVGLGCVDCRFEHIDTPEEIVARVEKALEVLSPSRIVLNPDCGFAPGSERMLSLDEPYLKLKNEVAAAKILREKYRSS